MRRGRPASDEVGAGSAGRPNSSPRATSLSTNAVSEPKLPPPPHYRAPGMTYVEGSMRPISMYRLRKYVMKGAVIVEVGGQILVVTVSPSKGHSPAGLRSGSKKDEA